MGPYCQLRWPPFCWLPLGYQRTTVDHGELSWRYFSQRSRWLLAPFEHLILTLSSCMGWCLSACRWGQKLCLGELRTHSGQRKKRMQEDMSLLERKWGLVFTLPIYWSPNWNFRNRLLLSHWPFVSFILRWPTAHLASFWWRICRWAGLEEGIPAGEGLFSPLPTYTTYLQHPLTTTTTKSTAFMVETAER